MSAVRFVESGSVTIAVHDFGGEGHPVLFSHAAGLCARTWNPLVQEITKNFRCFGVDFRAHGRSTHIGEVALHWQSMAEDIIQVCSFLREANLVEDVPFLGVGHSMGGTVNILAALAEPQLFRKLWAYEPIFFSSDPIDAEPRTVALASGARKRKKTFVSREEAFERYSKKPPFCLFVEEALRGYVQDGLRMAEASDGCMLSCDPENEAQIYENANSGVTEQIDSLAIPLHVVLGADDGDRVPAIKNVLRSCSSSKITHTEYLELSHFGVQEQPKEIGESLLSWCLDTKR